MTRRTANSADTTTGAAEMPTEGGSYERQPDGSLKRVAFTNHDGQAEDPAVETSTGTAGQEG